MGMEQPLGNTKDIEEFNSGVKRKRDAAAPKAPELMHNSRNNNHGMTIDIN